MSGLKTHWNILKLYILSPPGFHASGSEAWLLQQPPQHLLFGDSQIMVNWKGAHSMVGDNNNPHMNHDMSDSIVKKDGD
jgi:hypothetical protein